MSGDKKLGDRTTNTDLQAEGKISRKAGFVERLAGVGNYFFYHRYPILNMEIIEPVEFSSNANNI